MTLITGEIKSLDDRSMVIEYLDPEKGEEKQQSMSLKYYPFGKVGDILICGWENDKLVRDDKFVQAIFEKNVTEIQNGKVEIVAMARDIGRRLKIAVRSLNPKINPIAACIGQSGSVISKITKELGNTEKIDVLAYSDNPEEFIAYAITPAKKAEIVVNEDDKSAEIRVDEENLGLTIGKGGMNIKLASKLTGYKLSVKVVGIEIYDLDLPKNVVSDLIRHKITTIQGMHDVMKDKQKMAKLDVDTIFYLKDLCKNDPKDGIICPCCGTEIDEEPENGKIICPRCGEDIKVKKS